ncbi:hypothetical protein LCGC14_2072600 [marine sediment metagenome]|uniref:Uncharacterized protein n=1 Tax=marine sediment metagenome TaxID=412755 RepID=A0A0F9EHU1_9ZZZZ
MRHIKKIISMWILLLLRNRNFRLREEGKLPDKWYWADIEIFRREVKKEVFKWQIQKLN